MANVERNLSRLAEGHDNREQEIVSSTGAAHAIPETGVVRKMKEGFGFIAGNDGLDYFFHWTALQKTSVRFSELEVGDRVEFLKLEAPKGPRAIEIKKVA
jgi:CspA family cold shock protein